MIIPVVVEGQSLRWYGRIPEIADNSIEFVQLEFRFPEDWDGMVIVAQFTQTKTYNCLLVNNRCFLPMELVAGPCEVSVFGYLNEKVTRGTTISLKFNISRSGFVSSAETPIPPTPDLYAQLIEYFSSIAGSGGGGSGSGTINPGDIAAAVEDYLSKNPPEPGAPGEPGEPGEDGGYYTPGVSQPDADSVQFSFTGSKPSMPTVPAVSVSLPKPEVVLFDFTQYNLPVLELTGDTSAMTKENPVDLQYVYGDRSGTASVKWQGSSSLAYPKKNYTIKFDNAFEAAPGWGEQKKYCLKANYVDHSHARNVVSAKLWGQVVKSRAKVNDKLGALPNGGAVDGFPICVTINGEYHGLYTFNIPKDGWMFGLGEGNQECILCAEGYSPATRFTGEALCDGSDYSIEYITDGTDTTWAVESLNRLISACLSSDGSDIDTTIAQYVDIDSAIDFFIFTCLTSGSDNFDKNHLLVTFDGVKWYFSVYDMDTVYGNEWTGKSYISPLTVGPLASWYSVAHTLMDLITHYKTSVFKQRYEDLRSGVLSPANVITEFTNYMANIPSVLYDEELKIWPMIPGTKSNDLAQIATHYMLRVPVIDHEVDNIKATVLNYTNLVPTLLDPNSNSVYNNIGYSNNMHLNGDPIDPGVHGNRVITGLLPYAIKSASNSYPPIYIKGPNLDMDRFDSVTCIYYYNSTKENKWVNTLDTLYFAFTKTDLGDNYFRLDVNPSVVGNALGYIAEYLSFTFPGLGEGMIITIGEPIE
jgi:hypothetical protein